MKQFLQYFTSFLVLASSISANNDIDSGKPDPSSGIHLLRNPMLELRCSSINRSQLRMINGGIGNKFISLRGGLNPLDFYQFSPGNIRIGILSPIAFGLGTFIPLGIAYPSTEGMRFVEKYFPLFLAPGYLLNPEIQIGHSEYAWAYTGYSWNLVHDKRVRPVYALNAGIGFKVAKMAPDFRIGYEQILYRGNRQDCLLLGVAFGQSDP